MKILIKNIKKLVQVESPATIDGQSQWVRKRAGEQMSHIKCIDDAFLLIEDGKIAGFGAMSAFETEENSECYKFKADVVIDATGKMVFPSFCDSHTHLVYAGSREGEFFDKINGLSYTEIAKRGGGILNSSRLLHDTSEEELYRASAQRVNEIIAKGTGAVEIKSGYGLNLEDELKMLRVIKRISEQMPVTVKATFLGAHAVPERFNGDSHEYTNEVINEMIPIVAAEELAHFVDVFCENGFFSQTDTDRILNAAIKYGLRPKVHANQMSFSGGVQTGIKYNAISVDHLEYIGEQEISLLKNSDTMPTLLPGSTFFLGMDYPPAKQMIKAGLPLAIASNYNPGSSPSGDMRFMMFLAALNMKLTINELINATTINGAAAMDLDSTHGTIAVGKTANIFITKEIPSIEFFVYSYSTPLIDTIILNGKVLN